MRPRLLLLDEPATGLNPKETEALASLLLEVRARLGVSVLVIEHDMALVGAVADSGYVMDFGQIIAVGTGRWCATTETWRGSTSARRRHRSPPDTNDSAGDVSLRTARSAPCGHEPLLTCTQVSC